MSHYLLTGAGFSRNWGGWLATEAFEYLLGCPELNDDIRAQLWKSRRSNLGFENTLEELRKATINEEPAHKENLKTFELMLQGMFDSMNNGFKNIELNRAFDPHTIGNSIDYIRPFLAHFDAIFTLNQDCLLELKYDDKRLVHHSGGRFRDLYSPGLDPIVMAGQPYQPPGLYKPGSKTYQPDIHRQPYYKLHGSSNWRDGDSTMLIMGGNKGPNIEKNFLLRSYRDRFTTALTQPDTKLVIIGYSFQDEHINKIIVEGCKAGLQLFLIDPAGVDVVDNAERIEGWTVAFKEFWGRNIVGASRRNLIETFWTDHVERAKIQRFISQLGP